MTSKTLIKFPAKVITTPFTATSGDKNNDLRLLDHYSHVTLPTGNMRGAISI